MDGWMMANFAEVVFIKAWGKWSEEEEGGGQVGGGQRWDRVFRGA